VAAARRQRSRREIDFSRQKFSRAAGISLLSRDKQGSGPGVGWGWGGGEAAAAGEDRRTSDFVLGKAKDEPCNLSKVDFYPKANSIIACTHRVYVVFSIGRKFVTGRE